MPGGRTIPSYTQVAGVESEAEEVPIAPDEDTTECDLSPAGSSPRRLMMYIGGVAIGVIFLIWLVVNARTHHSVRVVETGRGYRRVSTHRVAPVRHRISLAPSAPLPMGGNIGAPREAHAVMHVATSPNTKIPFPRVRRASGGPAALTPTMPLPISGAIREQPKTQRVRRPMTLAPTVAPPMTGNIGAPRQAQAGIGVATSPNIRMPFARFRRTNGEPAALSPTVRLPASRGSREQTKTKRGRSP